MGLCFNGVLLAVPAGVETWNWTTVAQPWRLINLPLRRGFQILTTEYYYYYRIQIAVMYAPDLVLLITLLYLPWQK